MKKYLIVALIIIAGLSLWAYRAFASSVGPNHCSIEANNTSIGSLAWLSTTNACVSDKTTDNWENFPTTDTVSNYLEVTGFGFSVPTSATITGIVVEIERYADGVNTMKDNAVRIVKGGTIGTTDLSSSNYLPQGNNSTFAPYESYGSSSTLWGETWTYSDINSSNFGVAYSVKQVTGSDNIASVDDFRVTIYYTTSSGTVQSQVRSGNIKIKSGNVIYK